MWRKLGVGLVLLWIVLGVIIAFQPAEFRISRSRTLVAPPPIVFSYIDDLRKWSQWSPWEKVDPAMSREYSGAATGPGAVYAWDGNDDVGSGRMTIIESRPQQSVTLRLEFFEPWQATNTAQFELAPRDGGTQLTWSMTGRNRFLAKAAAFFLDIEGLVGRDFERGLNDLDLVTAAAASGR